MDMFDRLEDTVNRYEDITAELGNPDVVNDQNRFRKLMKEQSSLAPLIATYTEYKNCKQTIEDSLQLLDEESDEELKELAKEELNEAKKRVEELENEIKILLLPKDPNDDKDIIVEIRAGAGGDEAALFAARRNGRVVEMHDFELAKDKIMMGAERKSMVMTEDERRNTAYHESGHALVAKLMP